MCCQAHAVSCMHCFVIGCVLVLPAIAAKAVVVRRTHALVASKPHAQLVSRIAQGQHLLNQVLASSW